MTKHNRTLVSDLDLKPGDILLLRIEGWVGRMIWAMQLINRDTSFWTHAGVVLDDDTLFEAQPGGAVITPLSVYADRPGSVVRYYQKPKPGIPTEYTLTPIANFMTDTRRASIVRDARAMFANGYRYAYEVYVYLALYRFGIRPRWVRDAIQDPDAGICSQAADLLVADNAVHLFADGRMPYDVTPGDLATLSLP